MINKQNLLEQSFYSVFDFVRCGYGAVSGYFFKIRIFFCLNALFLLTLDMIDITC